MNIDIYDKYILRTYARYNVVFIKGRGNYLYDINNKKHLDFFSGLSVTNLGHCNKKLLTALTKQSKLLWHCSNLFYTLPQLKLAKLLVEKTFPLKVFFSNSGAEANECAIKLARKFGSKYGKHEIITFNNSFHGRTIVTLTATGQRKFHKGFEPLPKGFKYAKYNDIKSVKNLIDKNTVAIMIEPIQGEGGVNVAEKEFLFELRKICDKERLLLIFDEVQTAFGRTGEFFAYQYFNVKPDIITLAKSVANGLPLGITLVDEKYADIFTYGDHGSTFGGNLISCAVAYEVLKLITPKLLSRVKKLSKYFIEKLVDLKNRYDFIVSVRGVGFMVGVELNFNGRKIVEECLRKGLVINVTQEKVLRFLPPLTITEKEIDKAIYILNSVFSEVKKK
ncbi:MAG: aspartate aminotransferase family protein [Endomicrobia bacterium]|nr:aspartate aminotransferase family protein [Endomicrobiia bacterium]